ncbi:MAG: hypothetical protein ABIV10_12010, partial [Gemmatimonadaceae bacterium]
SGAGGAAVVGRPAPVSNAIDPSLGWNADRLGVKQRLALYGAPDGRRHAFVRFPDHRAVIIILTSSDDVDARGIAERIGERLLGKGR